MKFLSVFFLLVSVAECEPQFGGFSGGTALPLVGKKDITPKYRANAKRVVLSYGPLTLRGLDVSQSRDQIQMLFLPLNFLQEKKPAGGGFSMDPKGQGGTVVLSSKTGLCTNCTVISARFYYHNKDGTPANPANGFYIHHMLAYDMSKSSKVPIGADGLPSFPWAAQVHLTH
jgi:hypothetical protein